MNKARVLKFASLAVSVGIIATWFPHKGYSAYSRPIEWSDMNALDLRPVLRSQYASHGNLYDPVISHSSFDSVLNDSEKRISPEFHIPDVLKPSVNFWLHIYTEYSTQNVVIFDSNDLGIVYEMVDLRPLAQKARNQVVYEILSKRKIDTTMEAYRKAFTLLARNPRPKNPNREQKIIIEKFKGLKRHRPYNDLKTSVKFIRGQRDNVIKGLLSAEPFLPKMEMIFRNMQVPPELTKLSLVESSFDLRATSKVGASGVWQFMPAIGKKYLIIDDQDQIDERRSPLKSTVAAAKMLRWNYQYLGNWVLAVISYNHGLKNLPRSRGKKISFAQTAHLFESRGKKPILGWASRSYYCEFLAMVYAEAYRKHFFGEIPFSPVRPISFVPIKKHETALTFSMKNAVSLQEFKLLNADILDIHQPLPVGFWVVVPGHTDNIHDFVSTTLVKMKKLSQAPSPRHHHKKA